MTGYEGLVAHLLRARRYPALIFLFSRASVERAAVQVAEHLQLLRPEDAVEVRRRVALLPAAVLKVHPALDKCLVRGVGFHHAGLLPAAKKAVEEMFEAGYLPVVFCTETFAVGLNFPARTVVIGGGMKRGDDGFRPLTGREILQIGGRAGRRGTDRRGYVYFYVDPHYPDEVPLAPPAAPEPVEPRLSLEPTGVLRLIRRFGADDERIREYFRLSFAAYRARGHDAARASLEREVAEVERQLADLAARHDCLGRGKGHPSCPANWYRRKIKLERRLAHHRAEIQKAQRVLERARPSGKARRVQSRLAAHRQHAALVEAELEALPAPHSCHWRERVAGGDACPVAPELEDLLQKAAGLRRRLRELPDPAARMWDDFRALREALTGTGFVQGGRLTPKGELALAAGPGGVLFAEILNGLMAEPYWWITEKAPEIGGAGEWSRSGSLSLAAGLAGMAAGCLGERPDRATLLPRGPVRAAVRTLKEAGVGVLYDAWNAVAVAAWAAGEEIDAAARRGMMAPGDFVVLARRAGEVLRGSAGVAPPEVAAKLKEAHDAVWRDDVAEVL
jgi:superfamily II RNA helicase